jgi:hypothetical protein
MTEPILSSDEIWSKWLEIELTGTLPGDLEKFAAAIEAAVLEKVCGEPIYQTRWSSPYTVWGDVPKGVHDEYQKHGYADRRIVYALTRSKP